MPQYAVLIYASNSAHAPDATEEDLAEHTDHADDLVADDHMVLAYALTPRALATSIRASGVTDGPYLETTEIVAGFYVIDAPDLDAALAIAGTNPVIAAGGGVEVRPVHSGGPI